MGKSRLRSRPCAKWLVTLRTSFVPEPEVLRDSCAHMSRALFWAFTPARSIALWALIDIGVKHPEQVKQVVFETACECLRILCLAYSLPSRIRHQSHQYR